MSAIEKNLQRYLEAEILLQSFFATFNYCWEKCVAPELIKNGSKPFAACCQERYHSICDLDHPAFDRLREEREQLFGKPADHTWENSVSPCEYHNPNRGCLLATHKSPICISFLCRKGIDALREEHGIYAYDYLGAYYALEWILTGDLPDSQYLEFSAGIREMTERIARSRKSIPQPSQADN
ncbi:MAG: hypothetical protein C4519_03395 [Desulfobacteraceae bacterium]|nr:MAG: hypothetical protein C4519_03395 [Desulfobacteraceae bacterium]